MYLNSYWDPRFTMLPLVARLLGLARCPSVLIAPRGEFSPAALALKRHKKAAVDVIWKRVVRRSAGVTWHATSPHEAELIRSRFPGATIVVVPEAIADASASIEPSLVPSVPLKVIFVGRISPMKNLHLSIEALFHTRSEIQFDIFGPVEDDDYWRSCLDLARLLPHNVSLSHRGELQPEQVISMFARSEVFLFPTRGENFGHVIAESLAGGCPVLCSTNTPWSDLLDAGGGWAVRRLDAKALAEILDGYAELTAAERHARRLTAARVFADWQSARTTENVLVAAFSSRV
jgi:glycosyltransferase involved in cell wall biosynthesis